MRLTDQEAKALLSKPGIRVAANSCHDVSDLTGRMAKVVSMQVTLPEKGAKASTGKGGAKQTKCEMEYGRMLAMEFPGCTVEPFSIILCLANGHKYTPDLVVKDKTGIRLIAEVKQRGKNGFRQNSYQRAKVMFDQCRVEYPFWTWRWSEKHMGIWDEKNYYPKEA